MHLKISWQSRPLGSTRGFAHLITESLAEASANLAEIRADRQEFLDAAGDFKTDLKNMLTHFEGLGGEISEYTGLPVVLEFERERDLIDLVPDRAMAPLFRALASDGFSTFVTRLGESTAKVAALNAALSGSCEETLASSETALDTASDIKKLGSAIKLIGKGLSARGETGIAEKQVEIWGWVGLSIQDNKQKKWGARLDGISTVLSGIASDATNKIRYCTIADGNARILDQLSQFNLDLSGLDTPVSSRASQLSVDALVTAVHTRASQGSVDDLSQKVDALASPPADALMLRIQVERELSSGKAPPSVFFLPETVGGLLGTVRQTVLDAIAASQQAGLPVAKAIQKYGDGEAALVVLDYRTAYKKYQDAFNALW